MRRLRSRCGVLFFLVFMACSTNAFSLEIKSSAFGEGGYIPAKYTCESVDFSPPLVWSDIPEETKSFALICDDPDAPFGTWVHWVIFNIPPTVRYLEENAAARGKLPEGVKEGLNDFRRIGYGGPCPPRGKPHHYIFKLYALDTILPLERGATKKDLINAMQGHIIEQAQTTGLYKR